jgi:anti-sigma factor RsiW
VTLPDLHLAEDALAAYVDGKLSPAADERAARHLRSCSECRDAVDAEREAKALLGATPDPRLPMGLLARLLDVPMTADIGSTDRVLAIEGEKLGWTTGGSAADPRIVERRATAAVPPRPRASVRPVGVTRPSGRSSRVRRTRRGLAVSLAGLAFGVLASAATTNAPSSAAPSRPGESPGTTTARLVVGNTSPMDVSRAFLFRRPAGGTLAPAATNPGR